MNLFIGYYRVSTKKQDISGLGLEAQKKQVRDYVAQIGGQLIAEHIEVESGKKNNRPELEKALNTCKKSKATLIVAKLDRLSRTVSKIARLMESGTSFVACDMPHANNFTIHILAAVAEYERQLISDRTKAGLAMAKNRGVALGRAKENKAEADNFARDMIPVIRELRESGIRSVRATVQALNDRGIQTARGGSWHVPTVQRLLKRIERLSQRKQEELF